MFCLALSWSRLTCFENVKNQWIWSRSYLVFEFPIVILKYQFIYCKKWIIIFNIWTQSPEYLWKEWKIWDNQLLNALKAKQSLRSMNRTHRKWETFRENSVSLKNKMHFNTDFCRLFQNCYSIHKQRVKDSMRAEYEIT